MFIVTQSTEINDRRDFGAQKPPAQRPSLLTWGWKHVGNGKWIRVKVPAPTTPPPTNDKVRYWL